MEDLHDKMAVASERNAINEAQSEKNEAEARIKILSYLEKMAIPPPPQFTEYIPPKIAAAGSKPPAELVLAVVNGLGNFQEERYISKSVNAPKDAAAIIYNCPEPKRKDIYKIMALQAHSLGEYGLLFLGASQDSIKNKKFFLDYGMKLIKESRESFKELLRDPGFDQPELLTDDDLTL